MLDQAETEAIITNNQHSWLLSWSVIDLPQLGDGPGGATPGGCVGEIQICSGSPSTDWKSDKLYPNLQTFLGKFKT